jgi:hypothetical protein
MKYMDDLAPTERDPEPISINDPDIEVIDNPIEPKVFVESPTKTEKIFYSSLIGNNNLP